MRNDTEKQSVRWYAQKWLFDNTIALLGPEVIASGALNNTYDRIGYDVLQEVQMLRTRVRRFGDLGREAKKLAIRRENFAKENEAQKHYVTARENYFAAALFYGSARWTIFEDGNPQLKQLDSKVTECYQKFAQYADHPIERVKIPFEGTYLPAYFHRPSQEAKKFPVIAVLQGMDSFKELGIRLNGDRMLQRGFAVLAFEGPGQGEAVSAGLKVKVDSFDKVAKSVMDYLAARKDVSVAKVGLYGLSFGTYWGPRMMANEPRFKAGAFVATASMQPGGEAVFNYSHPAYKLRHMWMAGYTDEDQFDEEYSSKLTLAGMGAKIKNPVMFAAGDEDFLAPIESTYDFYKTIAGPKRLMVYEGQPHGVGDPQLSSIVGDFFADVFSGLPLESGVMVVESSSEKRSMVKEYTPP